MALAITALVVFVGCVGFFVGRRYEKAHILKNNDPAYRLAVLRSQLRSAEKQVLKLEKQERKYKVRLATTESPLDKIRFNAQISQIDGRLKELTTLTLPHLRQEIQKLENVLLLEQMAS